MVNRKRTVRWHRLLTIPWLLAGVVSWQAGRSERQGHAGEGLFRDVTDQSGIDFVHEDGATGQQFLVEFMGAGVASLDYDLDGLMDVYFCNGHPLQSGEVAGQSIPGNAMFRNISRSGLAFSRVSAMSRADVRAYSLGVTAADYDNDGFPDLAISNYGKNTLLHNNGDGTFTEVTGTAGIDDEQRFSAGINFADVDGDGDLDLFIANYVDFTLERHREVAPGAFPYPPGPKDFPHLADSLYVNQGDGTFRNASRESGIGLVAGPSMGSIAGDFDRDGDVDLFVCCDGMPNHLFENDGSGRFVESAFVWGVALDATGAANGSMGVDAADLNGDGYDDFLVTDYTRQWPMLFLSLDRGVYEDAARRTQIGAMVAPHVNWTAALFDVDNDGDLDALICNGHFLRQAKQLEPGTDFAVEDVVMIDQGGLRFAPGRLSRGGRCNGGELSRCCVRGFRFGWRCGRGRPAVWCSGASFGKSSLPLAVVR
ncbi:MAG: hypothetical protein KatS3mg111_4352 [Pirellulaceae bacterium]|nr:MAG: hypothetical protein KatS3mg111_4352 [Pirellulaceae bacterium]